MIACFIEAADGAGDLPFEDVVTITMNGSTAEVTHTAHGLSSGQKVNIQGANESELNGVKTIQNVATDSYDYVVSESPSPVTATGTITSTGVVLEGTTNASGLISDLRSYSVDQEVTGWARQGTVSPKYKTAELLATVDKDTGASIIAVMISDE